MPIVRMIQQIQPIDSEKESDEIILSTYIKTSGA